MYPSSIDMKHHWKCEDMRYECKMTWGWPTKMDVTADGKHKVTSLKQRKHDWAWHY